jgi:HSP20 family molecular chaperone IbpA
MSDERPAPDRDDDSPSGVLGVVRQIVDALADAERTGRKTTAGGGRWSRGTRSVEYGFTGRLGGLLEGGDADREGGTQVIRETLSHGDEEYLVDVREVAGGVLVVADAPGVDTDDFRIRLTDDRTTIVVVLDGESLGRISLPWRAADVDPVYHHGVLEISVTQEVVDR